MLRELQELREQWIIWRNKLDYAEGEYIDIIIGEMNVLEQRMGLKRKEVVQ
jgi:hypothetical protein